MAGRHVCPASALDPYRVFCEGLLLKHLKPLPNEASSICWCDPSWFLLKVVISTGSLGFRIHISCFIHTLFILLIVSENVQQGFLVNKTRPGFMFGALEIYMNNTFKPTRHYLLSCSSITDNLSLGYENSPKRLQRRGWKVLNTEFVMQCLLTHTEPCLKTNCVSLKKMQGKTTVIISGWCKLQVIIVFSFLLVGILIFLWWVWILLM